jgi:hypothetical protein
MGVGRPTVQGALAILRYLVGLSSEINDNNDAWNVAIIYGITTNPDFNRNRVPNVNDALQILRYLVGLPNEITARREQT